MSGSAFLVFGLTHVVLCFSAFNLPAQEAYLSKKFTVEELKEDFNTFRYALEESHPGLYWFYSENEINERFNQLAYTVEIPQTEKEFFTNISSFVSSIGCLHTTANPSEKFVKAYFKENKLYFPLKLKLIGKKAFIYRNLSKDDDIQLGGELTMINNVPMDSIITTLLAHLSNDGYGKGWASHRFEKVFHIYYDYFIKQHHNYCITVKDALGSIKEKCLKGLTYHQKDSIENIRYGAVDRSPFLQLKWENEINTAILKIRRFSNWQQNGKNVSFKKLLHDYMTAICQKNIDNLIIDIGELGGGNELLGMTLLSYLIHKPFTPYKAIEFTNEEYETRKYSNTSKREYSRIKKSMKLQPTDSTFLLINTEHTKPITPSNTHYSGNLYLLTSRSTASATSDFVAWIHSLHMATIIGEETGGGYVGNTSNWEFKITLPNTKIIVNIPLARYFNNVNENAKMGRGIMPDHHVSTTIENVLNNVNAPLEYALKLIRKQH